MTPDDLLGRPYRFGGRGPDAYDCWGVVVALCPQVPDMIRPENQTLQIARLMAQGRADAQWQRVMIPQTGDICLFYKGRVPYHAGVWWRGRIVQAVTGLGVCSLPPPRDGTRIEVYRWAGSPTPTTPSIRTGPCASGSIPAPS